MIYLDPLMNHGWRLRGRPAKSCHAFTDGPEEELHQFAEKIGLKRRWFQSLRVAKVPHYDIHASRHQAALAAGAVVLTMRGAVELWRKMGWIKRPQQAGQEKPA